MTNLFFFGDSITTGAWDVYGGWANRLCARIVQETIETDETGSNFYCLPYNLGVSGDTTENLLQRLQSEIQARTAVDMPGEAIELVFAIGVNDSVHMVDVDRPRFSDARFRENLERLIQLWHGWAGRISFIGLTPVDDSRVYPIPWAPDKAYTCNKVSRFERIISNVCADKQVPFLPLFDNWYDMPDYKTYLYDGVHPTTEGHALLTRQIGDFLLDNDFYRLHTEG